MTEEVLEAVQTACQAWAGLSSVKSYHKFSGMLPEVRPTISIACGPARFKQEDNDTDEVTLPVEVLVYLQNQMDPVKAEQAVRVLAEQVRYALLADSTLGGVVDHTDVKEIIFETNELEKTQLLHYSVVSAEMTFFTARTQPGTTPPLLQEIDLLFNSETIAMEEV